MHPNKLLYLASFGGSYMSHYECLDRLTNLEGSIPRIEEEVQLTEDGNPNKLLYLSNLSGSLLSCYK
jgi:hypothetical protein